MSARRDASVLRLCGGAAALVILGVLFLPALADSEDQATKSPQRYTLRYKFAPGVSLRWKVVHRCRVRTTVSGATKTVETVSTSEKVWRVKRVEPDGSATFEHLVAWVDMRHQLTGSAEVHYDSRTDLVPPHGFEYLAQSVGVPLSIVTLDARGKVVKRTRLPVKAAVGGEGEMTVVLPEGPVAVGEEWSVPQDIELPLPKGGVRKIKARQCFALLGVKTGVATIRLATQILSPVHDPAVEAQLIQFETAGTLRFDIDAGRVLGQEMGVDQGVVGFRGEASDIHYLTQFSEEFVSAGASVAARAAERK
jgi:hypothetical protein